MPIPSWPLLTSEALGDKFIKFCANGSERSLSVHLKLACDASPYLTNACEGIDGEVVTLEIHADYDRVLSSFATYLYRGVVPQSGDFEDRKERKQWAQDMRNLYFLAEDYGINDLANKTMDAYQDHQLKHDRRHTSKEVEDIYENTRDGSSFRLYCAVEVAAYSLRDFNKGGKQEKPKMKSFLAVGQKYPQFVLQLVQAQTDYRTNIITNLADHRERKEEKGFGPCEFHTHSPGEMCHATGVTILPESENELGKEDNHEVIAESSQPAANEQPDTQRKGLGKADAAACAGSSSSGRKTPTQTVLPAPTKTPNHQTPPRDQVDLQERREAAIESTKRKLYGEPSGGRDHKRVAVKVEKDEGNQWQEQRRGRGLGLDDQLENYTQHGLSNFPPVPTQPLDNMSHLRIGDIPPYPNDYPQQPSMHFQQELGQFDCQKCRAPFQEWAPLYRHLQEAHGYARLGDADEDANPLLDSLSDRFLRNTLMKHENEAAVHGLPPRPPNAPHYTFTGNARGGGNSHGNNGGGGKQAKSPRPNGPNQGKGNKGRKKGPGGGGGGQNGSGNRQQRHKNSQGFRRPPPSGPSAQRGRY